MMILLLPLLPPLVMVRMVVFGNAVDDWGYASPGAEMQRPNSSTPVATVQPRTYYRQSV